MKNVNYEAPIKFLFYLHEQGYFSKSIDKKVKSNLIHAIAILKSNNSREDDLLGFNSLYSNYCSNEKIKVDIISYFNYLISISPFKNETIVLDDISYFDDLINSYKLSIWLHNYKIDDISRVASELNKYLNSPYTSNDKSEPHIDKFLYFSCEKYHQTTKHLFGSSLRCHPMRWSDFSSPLKEDVFFNTTYLSYKKRLKKSLKTNLNNIIGRLYILNGYDFTKKSKKDYFTLLNGTCKSDTDFFKKYIFNICLVRDYKLLCEFIEINPVDYSDNDIKLILSSYKELAKSVGPYSRKFFGKVCLSWYRDFNLSENGFDKIKRIAIEEKKCIKLQQAEMRKMRKGIERLELGEDLKILLSLDCEFDD
ncbi:hypothetical protein ACFFLZ_05580 [Photobacterium aphoticum]|uniref:Uncharacterized protein n=1 Tax=Photobacterium aphoticum TaxID=754436 RepID=A0A0J1JIM8_9GAMM|nr:hypothetical protein [Photobacterium aphoticum]KLV01867.1 hypothetical protein ABT58_05485 [Photobacterium aphoticum]PSU60096.1 hypothetical protein C9I90_00245 [Photobacterium aphoticum]GHA33152.1 hypothetical protein GCM10007086_02970 [Photobacterium aphoticum]